MSTEVSTAKAAAIKQHGRSERDTGSPEVQIALLTQRIEWLTKHATQHVKDQHSAHGMMTLINKRKRLLKYLQGEDINRYRATIAALGLRK